MVDEQSTEDRLIASLFARHAADGATVLTGPGDDAAVVRCPSGEALAITTDTLNEGVHFPAGAPARSIGHRALAVSLSDLAAMGARPLWAVVTLSVPRVDESWLEAFADGLFALAEQSRIRVVGGDFARGPLNVTVTAHGAAKLKHIHRRMGAHPGDGIWVSGYLGDAAAGLELLQQRLKSAAPVPSGNAVAAEEALIERFCYPRPRLKLGAELAGIASACMDISDGLAVDLPRLLRANRLAGRLCVEKLPISRELKGFADAAATRRLSMSGGDDYELCFTAARADAQRLKKLSARHCLTQVGEVRAGEGLEITFRGHPWSASKGGYAHFP